MYWWLWMSEYQHWLAIEFVATNPTHMISQVLELTDHQYLNWLLRWIPNHMGSVNWHQVQAGGRGWVITKLLVHWQPSSMTWQLPHRTWWTPGKCEATFHWVQKNNYTLVCLWDTAASKADAENQPCWYERWLCKTVNQHREWWFVLLHATIHWNHVAQQKDWKLRCKQKTFRQWSCEW